MPDQHPPPDQTVPRDQTVPIDRGFDGETEPLTAVRPHDTLELPGTVQPPAVQPPAVQPLAVQPAPAGRAAPADRAGAGNRRAAIVGAVLVGGAALALAVRLFGGGPFGGDLFGGGAAAPATGPTPSVAATVLRPADITSFDPSGGSGLRPAAGGTWRTQTYVTDRFGGLKEGVGLLLDLGAPRAISTVTVPVVSDAVRLELRTADTPADSLAGYRKVGDAVTGTGTVTLKAGSAGSHRYWLVWVTRLAPQDNGFAAVLGTPVPRG